MIGRTEVAGAAKVIMKTRIRVSFRAIALAVIVLALSAVQSQADALEFGFTGEAQIGSGKFLSVSSRMVLLTHQPQDLAPTRSLP
jgi:hypothetical protein